MTPSTESWTIGRLLTWTADYLRQRGSDSPRLDAEVLLAHARGCERIELYTCFDEVAAQPLLDAFRALVKRRAVGTPVAYLVGHREFYSRDFHVEPGVLIPRPETEFVLVALIDQVKLQPHVEPPIRIADVGTGSGVLAICAALQFPDAEVTALDISSAALSVAQTNAKRHMVTERVRLVQSDLYAALDPTQTFHFIMSNPPYVGLTDKQDLPRDVVGHEPHEALFAGDKGLDVLRRRLIDPTERLSPGGWLITEFSPPQQTALIECVAQQTELDTPKFIDDLTKRPRVMMVRRRAN